MKFSFYLKSYLFINTRLHFLKKLGTFIEPVDLSLHDNSLRSLHRSEHVLL